MKNKPTQCIITFLATNVLLVSSAHLSASESGERIEAAAQNEFVISGISKNSSEKCLVPQWITDIDRLSGAMNNTTIRDIPYTAAHEVL